MQQTLFYNPSNRSGHLKMTQKSLKSHNFNPAWSSQYLCSLLYCTPAPLVAKCSRSCDNTFQDVVLHPQAARSVGCIRFRAVPFCKLSSNKGSCLALGSPWLSVAFLHWVVKEFIYKDLAPCFNLGQLRMLSLSSEWTDWSFCSTTIWGISSA